LFIGLLAFPYSEQLQNETKFGVLLGSTAAGLVGWLILRLTTADFPKQR
jgi:NhaA family Na+:H+ antiporter